MDSLFSMERRNYSQDTLFSAVDVGGHKSHIDSLRKNKFISSCRRRASLGSRFLLLYKSENFVLVDVTYDRNLKLIAK